jgi:hypothetical protein
MLRLARENPRLHAAWLKTQPGTGRSTGMGAEAANASSRPASPAKTVTALVHPAAGECGGVETAAGQHAHYEQSVMQVTQHVMAAEPAETAHAPGAEHASVHPVAAAPALEGSTGGRVAPSANAASPVPPTRPRPESALDGRPHDSNSTCGGEGQPSSKRGGGPAAAEGSPERPIVRFSLQVTQEPRPPSSPVCRSTNMKVWLRPATAQSLVKAWLIRLPLPSAGDVGGCVLCLRTSHQGRSHCLHE